MLSVHRSDRADGLVGALAGLLASPLADPFAAEVIAVPTRGMERWLTQSVSAVLGATPGFRDGVCANVEFPFPHRLLDEVVATMTGVDPDQDPWLPERLAWTLLTVAEELLDQPWLSALSVFLGAGAGAPDPVKAARRLGVVRHLAGLYDRYALHRPQMLTAWQAGQDLDADGRPLAVDAAWQAELWRRLRARIGVPGPAERRGEAGRRLAEVPDRIELPPRISLFGLTRLPAGHLEILRALADRRDVHLFLLHPSPALWDKLNREFGATPGSGAPVASGRGPDSARGPDSGRTLAFRARAQDPTIDVPQNRLLASWGRDVREMQLVLAADERPSGSLHEPLPAPAATLLGRIQHDIRQDCPAPGAPQAGEAERRLGLDPSDNSIQIHACHGRARQVEVVRDAILHALTGDETLEPRDVIVMCPDIETFAPLIQATFGAGEETGAAGGEAARDGLPPTPGTVDLRVRLADRSLHQTNPVLGVVSRLLELAQQRLTASQVLDLIDRTPVRRRFRLDDDDLTRLQGWISQAGIRWGLDAAHRGRFKLERVPSGTWLSGLQRLLLGVTMTEDGQRLFADVLPLDDVDSRSIELAGRLAELIDRLGLALDALSRPQTLSAWAQAIAEAADALTSTPPRERWQRAELQRILDEMLDQRGAAASAAEVELAPAEIQSYLGERLAGRPTRANFRTGHLTVCTLMPMRSVPHRVVCLLGLDDGAFPRKTARDGDDLMLAEPHIGERDPRSEDRQLLLDALMASTQRLLITYSGNDERTNMARPPAVPVGELLDTIDATAHRPGGPASDRVLIRHPLQPFDPRNFAAGALTGATPWSFDRVTLGGARALTGARAVRAPFLAEPLPSALGPVLELDDLVRFVEHPCRAFLRQRLGIGLGAGAEDIADALPVELDGLDRWRVGQRLLEARLAGVDGNRAIKAEIARGTLPPGKLGEPVVRGIYPLVEAIAERAASLAGPGRPGDPLDVRVELPDGRRLSGTVAGAQGDVLLSATYSRVGPKHRLAAWVRLLAVTASRPEREFRTATVGRAGGRDDVRVACVGPLGADPEQRRQAALAELQILTDLYDRGLREPLPLFCATSAAYALAAAAGQDPVVAAEREWLSVWNFDREDRQPEHRYVLDGERTLSELMALPPLADEAGPGWADADPSRLGRLARRLWAGLLEREEVTAR